MEACTSMNHLLYVKHETEIISAGGDKKAENLASFPVRAKGNNIM